MSRSRREFLIRAGIVRPPMISAEQKARFVAECLEWNPKAFDEALYNQKPGVFRIWWTLLGWGGALTVAWIAGSGAVLAWLS